MDYYIRTYYFWKGKVMGKTKERVFTVVEHINGYDIYN